jgi:murein DD-endopeptidase MepM/ murein hydrolase activator NlpD
MGKRPRILAHLLRLRESRPRHFWAAAALGGTSFFGVVAAFAVAPTTAEILSAQQTLSEPVALSIIPHSPEQPALFVREERYQRGDSVAALFARMGIDDAEAARFVREDKKTRAAFQPMRPGTWVTARMRDDGTLQSFVFPVADSDRAVFVERREGVLQARQQALRVETRVAVKSGEVRSSLFVATDEANVPDNVAVQLTEIFGSEIDFHKDLRRGDRFAVVYEAIYYEGQVLRAGRVLAAEFVNGGKAYRAVYFDSDEGRGYFTPDGQTLKKAFLRSPLEISRISSGFAMRLHPITQDWRAHKGVDYAAPTGTRVKATADGVVEFIGQQSGYGNILVLQHHGKYTTHYGHLSDFAPGLKRGSRVDQGEVIGFVGMTGWATGPHLHYEFRIDGVHQNPLSDAIPVAVPLEPATLARFKRDAAPLLARMELSRPSLLAQLD